MKLSRGDWGGLAAISLIIGVMLLSGASYIAGRQYEHFYCVEEQSHGK